MKKYLLNLSLLTCLVLGGNVFGQILTTIAEDDASNYGSWTNSSNEGYGFGQWTLNANGGSGGFAGHFIDDPDDAGIAGMSSQSFGMFSNPSVNDNEAKARRFFTDGEMQIGDVFSFQLGMNWDAGNFNGFKGIDMLNSSGQVVFNVNMGGSSTITWGAPLAFSSGTLFSAYGTNAMNFTVTRINATQYRVEATPRTGATNFDQVLTFEGNIAGFELYSGRLDGGDERQVYLNNLKLERPIYFTIDDGDFYSPSTWVNGGIPIANTTIFINHNVVLDMDYTLEGEMNIAGGKILAVGPNSTLTNNGSIDVQGDLLFASNSLGTAQYGNSSGSITGDVTVERYIPARSDNNLAFRFLASSVNGVSIKDSWQQSIHVTGTGGATNNFDVSNQNNPSMFTFSGSWAAVENTETEVLALTKGYRTFVRGDRDTFQLQVEEDDPLDEASDVTLSAKGQLFTTTAIAVPNMSTGNHEFNFVGNPFQAVVDLNELTYGNGIENGFAYYWDPTLADNGAFVTINIGSNSSFVTDGDIPDPGTSSANKFLQPGQAVFFRNTDAAGTRIIEFNEAAKRTGEAQTAIFSETSVPYVNMRLYEASRFANGGKEQDAAGLRFFENGNNGIDADDAAQMGNTSENFALVNNNQLISIESRNLPEVGEVFSLFTNNYQYNNYVFHINIQNFPSDLVLRLHDNYLNETYTLQSGINEISYSVDFGVAASIANQRFSLEVDAVTLGVADLQQQEVELYPNPVSNQLNIRLEASMQAKQVQVFNVVGKQVMQVNLDASKEINQINTSPLSSGVYLVKVETSKGIFTQKLIKK